jgi:hypothetical protein
VTRLKWKLVLVDLEIMLILMQDSCSVCTDHTIGSKSFWMQVTKLQVDVGYVESLFVLFGEMLVSVQDRCTVCAKCTVGSKIILDALDGTPR